MASDGKWVTRSVGELLETIIDYRGKTPPKSPFGIPLISAANVKAGRLVMDDPEYISLPDYQKWTRRGFTQPGDVLITTEAPAGEVAPYPRNGTYQISRRVMALRPEPSRLDSGFLLYALQWSDTRRRLLSLSRGTTVPRVLKTDITGLLIPHPPLPEQQAIAHILGTLDDKIELNRRMNETLEAMARAIFKSWFVDFDPVRRNLERKNGKATKTNHQPTPPDSHPYDHLFPDSFEDSELGKIPKGWKAASVYSAAEVIYGAPFASAEFNTEGLGKPLIRIRDLPNENPRVFTTEEHPKGYLVKPGDIIVGMDGEFRAYLWGGVESWLNQRVCVFKPKNGFSAPFVRHSIVGLLADVEATETATTVIHLGKNDIDRFKILEPAKPSLTAFGRLAEPLFQRIVVNKQESRSLAALRDTLLPKLLSGELHP